MSTGTNAQPNVANMTTQAKNVGETMEVRPQPNWMKPIEALFGKTLPESFTFGGIQYSLSPVYRYIQAKPEAIGVALEVFMSGKVDASSVEIMKDDPGSTMTIAPDRVQLDIQWFLWGKTGRLVTGAERDEILAGRQRIGNHCKAKADVSIIYRGRALSHQEWEFLGFAYNVTYEMSTDGQRWQQFLGGGRDPLGLDASGNRLGMFRNPDPPFIDVNVGGASYGGADKIGGSAAFKWGELYKQPTFGPLFLRVALELPGGDRVLSNVVRVEVA